MIYIFKDGNMFVLSDANNVNSLGGSLLTEQEVNLITSTMNSEQNHQEGRHAAVSHDANAGDELRDPNAPNNQNR